MSSSKSRDKGQMVMRRDEPYVVSNMISLSLFGTKSLSVKQQDLKYTYESPRKEKISRAAKLGKVSQATWGSGWELSNWSNRYIC